MCGTILMPDGIEIDSIVEDGTCTCQNTQKEILEWIVQHLPEIEFDEHVEILRTCFGWEVSINKIGHWVIPEEIWDTDYGKKVIKDAKKISDNLQH